MGRGRFIVFEGTEGSGKSTQVRLLAERIERAGQPVLTTREPGGTAIGEAIRDLLLADATSDANPRTIALLHTAARAEHVATVIAPALDAGTHVLSDRFSDSTLAYQGGGSGLPIDELRALQVFAVAGCEPDLRILLKVDVEAGVARRLGDHDEVNWLDRAGLDFHRKVAAAFEALEQRYPAQWLVIDGEQPVEAVSAAIAEGVSKRFPELLR